MTRFKSVISQSHFTIRIDLKSFPEVVEPVSCPRQRPVSVIVQVWGEVEASVPLAKKGEKCEASGSQADTPVSDRDALTCGQRDVCMAETKGVISLSMKCV